jgi:hypothetical protein
MTQLSSPSQLPKIYLRTSHVLVSCAALLLRRLCFECHFCVPVQMWVCCYSLSLMCPACLCAV